MSTVLFEEIAVDDVTSATAPPFHPLLSLITSVFLYECLKITKKTDDYNIEIYELDNFCLRKFN